MMNLEDASNYLDALAAEMGANPETRRKWRERRKIAATWHARLLLAATERRKKLPPEVFVTFVPSPPPSWKPENMNAAARNGEVA